MDLRQKVQAAKDAGYSDEEIEKYISGVREVAQSNIEINSFMG